MYTHCANCKFLIFSKDHSVSPFCMFGIDKRSNNHGNCLEYKHSRQMREMLKRKEVKK
jgi:hypothetical protein